MGHGDNLSGLELTVEETLKGAKGSVMHVLTTSSVGFRGFGEAYFSTVDQGAIKGWKMHREVVANLVVPVGTVRFVVYDDRKDSTTRGRFQSVELSPEKYLRLTLPCGLWFAFKGIGPTLNLILNIATLFHDDNEVRSLPLINSVIPSYDF